MKLCWTDNLIIKALQQSAFQNEITFIQKRKHIVTNPLKSSSVFIDDERLIRVCGRIQKSSLSYNTKHSIILTNTHPFTAIIKFHYHMLLIKLHYLHAAPQALIAAVLERFWPIKSRRLAAKICRLYRVCFRANLEPRDLNSGN